MLVAPRRSRQARRKAKPSAGVPCVPTTSTPGVPLTQAFVGGAGEPGGPAPVVPNRVFKPFGAHSAVDRQWDDSRLRLKEARDRPPAFTGWRHAQMKLAAMPAIPVAAMVLIELYRCLFRPIKKVDLVQRLVELRLEREFRGGLGNQFEKQIAHLLICHVRHHAIELDHADVEAEAPAGPDDVEGLVLVAVKDDIQLDEPSRPRLSQWRDESFKQPRTLHSDWREGLGSLPRIDGIDADADIVHCRPGESFELFPIEEGRTVGAHPPLCDAREAPPPRRNRIHQRQQVRIDAGISAAELDALDAVFRCDLEQALDIAEPRGSLGRLQPRCALALVVTVAASEVAGRRQRNAQISSAGNDVRRLSGMGPYRSNILVLKVAAIPLIERRQVSLIEKLLHRR